MDYDFNLIYEGHAQLHGRQSLYILGLQSTMGTLITCSPKIPPHIENDGLGSFRRIWNNS